MLLYTYDAWNRLVAARRRVDAQTPVVAYEYDGLNRRIRRQVDNSGVGVVPGSDAGGIDGIQAGNLNEHYYLRRPPGAANQRKTRRSPPARAITSLSAARPPHIANNR